MQYTKVEVELAVEDGDDAAHIVNELIYYGLSRGLCEAVGLGHVKLLEERDMPMIEDDIPDWDAARKGE
jgi:hypothetical protein